MNQQQVFPIFFGAPLIIDAQLVPSSPTDLVVGDCSLFRIELTNETTDLVTVTIQDKQGTPRAWIKDVPIAPNSVYGGFWIEGRRFLGGVRWSASQASAITGYIIGVKP